MNFSAPFVVRPIATTLLMVGVTLLGLVAYVLLPIAGVPQVDIPTIRVSASLPGANAETMATSVATPLERQLALISGVTSISSTSSLGKTGIQVTTLGVGCAWLGRRADGSIDEETGLAAILAALDSGVRLIDTASLYAEGSAERVVGQALRARWGSPAHSPALQRLPATSSAPRVSPWAAERASRPS